MSTLKVVVATAAVSVAVTVLAQRFLDRRRRGLAERAQALLIEYLSPAEEATSPVVRLAAPSELEAIFDGAGCPLAVREGDAPLDEDALISAISLTLKYNTRSASLKFFNQLYQRADRAAIVGDWVSTAINASVYTYEVAPVLTLMEAHVITRIARAIGGVWNDAHDGLFLPGGSIGNMYSMHIARHRIAPQIHTAGAISGPRLVSFTSADSHYSYLKSARLLGLGGRLPSSRPSHTAVTTPSARRVQARTTWSRWLSPPTAGCARSRSARRSRLPSPRAARPSLSARPAARL